jgi:hypothetical protein
MGKLGPPVGMKLEVVDESPGEGGGTIVTMRLVLAPGEDLPLSEVEFIFPAPWEVLSGSLVSEVDLERCREKTLDVRAFIPEGAVRSAAARVRANGTSREAYAVVSGGTMDGRLEGRIDRSAGGSLVRVFPSGERGR